jgi:hypothetical protein
VAVSRTGWRVRVWCHTNFQQFSSCRAVLKEGRKLSTVF